jgi:hypothetical protein
MSKISERTLVLGKLHLSGKREAFTAFPWEIVSAGGVVQGWEPAEGLPMGRHGVIGIVNLEKPFDVNPTSITVMESMGPYFYDDRNGSRHKTLLHGGFVQVV